MKHDERELRALFETERAADARLAPSFAEITTDRVLARPAPAGLGWARPALAAACVLVVAVGIALVLRESPPPTPAKVAAGPTKSEAEGGRATPASPRAGKSPAPTRRIGRAKPPRLSEWQSPTAALLETPGDELWTTVPSIGTTASSLSE